MSRVRVARLSSIASDFGLPRLLSKSARVMATLNASAAERNKDHILKVLTQYNQYDRRYEALEVASGTGQHVVHFAQHMQNVSWQPSDCDQPSLSSLAARIKSSGVKNVAPPIFIDASQPCDQWGGGILQPGYFDIMTNVNMMHISPWPATQGLFKGAGVFLKEGGMLLTYGPYMIDGTISPESNVQFHQALKARCADWGLRDTAVLKELAKENHLHFETIHDVPANNKILVFRKKSAT
ncbi:methyltransferase-like 26 isoform X2 [Lineus longissimus]|uniref:methyltransferase-like 26 isoform X2 n=1 Tax=Lineus longissimus TaxID=88925 RepID=UPI002B4D15A1